MVKVVNKEPDPSVDKKTVCREGCGCTLEYVPNDVHYSTDCDGDTVRVWIVCPNCNKKVSVRDQQ